MYLKKNTNYNWIFGNAWIFFFFFFFYLPGKSFPFEGNVCLKTLWTNKRHLLYSIMAFIINFDQISNRNIYNVYIYIYIFILSIKDLFLLYFIIIFDQRCYNDYLIFFITRHFSFARIVKFVIWRESNEFFFCVEWIFFYFGSINNFLKNI